MSCERRHHPRRSRLPWAILAIAALPAATASTGASPSPAAASPAPAATSPAAVAASNWPQWRGPGGNGISTETDLPASWSATENVVWKASIEGRGHSSPIVWGGRIFLTTAVEGEVVPGAGAVVHHMGGEEFLHPDSLGADHRHTLKVVAIDAADGGLLWSRVAWEGTPYDNRHRAGSYASPTPTTDGDLVYAYFGTEGVYAYDFDGTLVWSADIGQIATMGMGVGTSPLLFEDLLIIQADEDEGESSSIVALDKRDGREVWRRPRPVQSSWTTPLLVEDPDGRTQLVTAGSELVIAYAPRSGEEIWRVEGLHSNAIHTPVAGQGMVFVTAGYPRKITKAIRLGGRGDLTGTEHVAWEYAKGTAYVASNLLYGDHLYLIADNGILTCLDARTGEVVYEGGRPPLPGFYKASPLAFDDKLLILSEEGDAFLIRAGPEFEILAHNALPEAMTATPALAGGRIYLRGAEHLWAIGSR